MVHGVGAVGFVLVTSEACGPSSADPPPKLDPSP